MPSFEDAAQWASKLGSSPVVAQVLHNRGCRTIEDARAFLNPKMEGLHAPELLPNILTAASRLARAVADKEKITLYGDYDVDGMTGLAVLHSMLRLANANVHWYVPHRLEEGYGVNIEAIRKIIADGTKLIVTIDCGISANEPLAIARQAGVEVIITDHHKVPEILPDVLAIVHPALPGSQYPNPDLSGSGVAFKLAWQLALTLTGSQRVAQPMRDLLLESMCLAALGIIADVVPLIGENRIFATFGLKALPTTKHVGLKALLDASSLAGQSLDAYHVGFVLAPRLNACGRMGHAALAVELLTDAPPQRSHQIAQYLTQQNELRQKVEREITEEAFEMVRQKGLDQPQNRAIVLANEKWHAGVIGIVASRLVDKFHRPAVMIALSSEGGQGSGRSIPGYNLHDGLKACEGHLISCGGHAMAGGLRIERDKIEAFAAAFAEHAGKHVHPQELHGTLNIDATATLNSLDHNLAAHLGKLAPFGQANQPALLAFEKCKIVGQPKRMGRAGNTLCLTLGQNGLTMRAIGFGMGESADSLGGIGLIDVAAEPTINSFNGRQSVELKIKDIRLPTTT